MSDWFKLPKMAVSKRGITGVDVDSDALSLSEWVGSINTHDELPRPQCEVPGLVLVAEWGWANNTDHLHEQYQQICEVTASESQGTMFCKPAHASHFTIALLSSFKRPHDAPRADLTLDEEEEYLQAWRDALKTSFSDDDNSNIPKNRFDVEAYKVEISHGAAIILFKDETDSMRRLRSMVEHIIDNDSKLSELDQRYHGKVKSNVFIPNIIHSSYARFIKIPSIHQNVASFSDFKINLEANISRVFQPFKVNIQSIVLANETSPYMHQEQNESTSLFSFDLQ